MLKRLTVNTVAVAEAIGRCGVVRKGAHHLLGRPGSRVLGDVEVDDGPAVVGKHNENEQDASSGERQDMLRGSAAWSWRFLAPESR
jgi:hypothetical protein